MRKQEKYMLVILILMIFVTISISKEIKKQDMTQKDEPKISTEEHTKTPISDDKKRQVYKFVEGVILNYPFDEFTVIDVRPLSIENDENSRYLIESYALAIDCEQNIEAYTFYVVIQEDQKGELYVMPFGVEVVKGQLEPLKEDILISSIKVVNGWGSTKEEFQARWQHSRFESYDYDLETIYKIQQIMKFTTEYVQVYLQALDTNDFSYIQDYLVEGTLYYRNQKNNVATQIPNLIRRDIKDLTIQSVTKLPVDNTYLTSIQGTIYLYYEDVIYKSLLNKTYKISLEEPTPKVLGEIWR